MENEKNNQSLPQDDSVDEVKKEDKPKVKVGRKDRKHNWWNGCDYVWVDGIDHWVARTAFRNDKNKEPEYTLNNYVQGLDSYWVMRYKPNKK